MLRGKRSETRNLWTAVDRGTRPPKETLRGRQEKGSRCSHMNQVHGGFETERSEGPNPSLDASPFEPKARRTGGERGIRTLGRGVTPTRAFQARRLNRSRISPRVLERGRLPAEARPRHLAATEKPSESAFQDRKSLPSSDWGFSRSHWHRCSGGTPLSAVSMCCPHPAHVGFPHLEH